MDNQSPSDTALDTLLKTLSAAIRRQDWQALSRINRQIADSFPRGSLSVTQQQQLQTAYQAGLAQCQRDADDLWHKIQQTLAEREAMAAYACFADQDSFAG
ncbi:hypothetical protein GCM10009414_00790 [Tatumella terrea]|uniref:Flagellar protein FliT n=1 Tax=Tatumella terrea TaxID=419007 RepID=A0ABW1W238_9GAMM|nr:hypothetical protein [Tatumella sp. JGM118]MBS0909909.1 hypothetical protein [Tatumella sp. JGM118]